MVLGLIKPKLIARCCKQFGIYMVISGSVNYLLELLRSQSVPTRSVGINSDIRINKAVLLFIAIGNKKKNAARDFQRGLRIKFLKKLFSNFMGNSSLVKGKVYLLSKIMSPTLSYAKIMNNDKVR